jgi:Raf kinase inhibitor-like YbhB/YbcL family protein
VPERRAIVVLTASLLLLAACDTDDGRQLEEPTAQQRAAMPTTSTTTSTVPGLPLGEPSGAALTSTTGLSVAPTFAITGPWIEGAAIDPQYTCDGAGLAPLVAWTTPPPGTLELALMVTDPDAGDFVHWAVAGIPATAGQIGAGAVVPGAREGTNDFGNPGWGGPCPPSPGETHTYRWTLYALDQQNQLPEGFAGTDLQTLAFDTAFASTQLSGTYTRAG